ncbi:MAG: hybrid sensor histidine kinase/response regulator [Candidatus Brocadiae bacterium]|nr:hybrid sensor histidine kinase/response regulator [Candidatus Brocadiia bacterium]
MEKNKQSIILIVDNDPVSRETLEGLLSALGHPVLSASYGEQALEIAENGNLDLIILDVALSDMDGFELCRRFRTAKKTRLTPIIIVTALNDKSSRIRGITAGCDDFLSKPFDNLELVLRIGSLLKMQYYRDQLNEKEKFELAMKHASEAMIITDQYGKIEQWNEVADQLFSLKKQVQKNLFDVFKEYFNMEPEMDWNTLPYSFPLTFQLQRSESKQGEELILFGKMFLMSLSVNQEKGYFVAFRDVSRKIREEKRKDQFIHLISHKFRSACTIFMGSLSLLEQIELEEEKFSQDTLQIFKTLQIGSQRIYQIFNRILEITEILSHKENIRPTPISGGEIQKMVRSLAANIGIKDDSIRWENFSETLAIPMESKYLEMILMEILENSFKYCPKENLKITLALSRNMARKELKIKDNGPGIPQEELGRLGDRFVQIEKSFSGNLPGLGLGLFLVHEILEQIGGEVHISSAPNQGLEITLAFA